MRKEKAILMRIFAGFMVMIMLFTGSSFTVLAEGLRVAVNETGEISETIGSMDISIATDDITEEVTEEEMTENESEEISEEIIEETTEISSEEMSEESGKEITEDASEETSEKTPEDTSEEESESEEVTDIGVFQEQVLEASTGSVDRITWLNRLVEAFEMNVEKDNYPDNYYSDLDSSYELYKEVMIATEFGLVDVDAGDALQPNAPATREFVAHTLNACVGYINNKEYSFSEKDSVSYPDDIQVAIDNGWFTLSGGSFLPNQSVTEAEADRLISMALEAVDAFGFEENHTNSYVFKSDIKLLPDDVSIVMTETDEYTISDSGISVRVGDRIGFVSAGIPLACKVLSKKQNENGDVVITTESIPATEAFEVLDIQQEITSDVENIIIEGENTTVRYIVGGTKEKGYADGTTFYSLESLGGRDATAISVTHSYDIPSDVREKYDIAPGIQAEITCTYETPKIRWEANFNEVEIVPYTTIKLTANVSFDVVSESSGLEVISFGKVNFGPAYADIAVGLSLEGNVTLCLEEYIEGGIYWSWSTGFQLVKKFEKKAFTITAHAEGRLIAMLSLGFDAVVAKGKVMLNVGFEAELDGELFTDGEKPASCTQISAWLISSINVSIKVLGKEWSKNHTIFEKSNSPIKVRLHFEDGQNVPKCTRGEQDDPQAPGTGKKIKDRWKYFTPYDSQYGYGGGNNGYDSAGNEYTIFEYSLNDANEATITSYNGNVSALNIPDTLDGYKVVGIGKNVFQKNTKLRMVVIPDSVTEIGSYAFSNCTNLSCITLGSGLQEIGSSAFNKCTSLEKVDIPDTVTEIGYGAFRECTRLSDVKLSKGLLTLGYEAFGDCTSLKEIYIPKGIEDSNVTSAGGPFARCSNLKKVEFEEGITHICRELFEECNGIEEIEIPDTVTSIGSYAFSECPALSDVKLSKNLQLIESSAFYKCTNLEKVDIPDTVTEIGYGAFRECTHLSDVKLSKGLLTLGYEAFGDCTSLKEIYIPKSIEDSNITSAGGPFARCSNLKKVEFEEGITHICRELFEECNGIEEIEIPDTVTSIGSYAFSECPALSDVKLSKNLQLIESSAFYKCTNLEKVDIPDTVTEIEYGAFRECTRLSDVKLSKGLLTLGYEAFGDCTSLKEIYIPKSIEDSNITSAGGPFARCSNLKKVEFEEGITHICRELFEECNGIEEIEIPDTVTTIGSYAFSNCTSLKKVTLNKGLSEIESYAFSKCSVLQQINLPDSLTLIGSTAFENCKKLEEISIPDSVTSIRYNAFKGCESLKKITLPKKLTVIEKHMFSGCAALVEIEIPKEVTVIEEYAFNNCDSIVMLTLPEKLQKIDKYAFYDCDALTTITIPDKVASLGNYVFAECDLLKNVKLGTGIDTIPTYAFNNCAVLDNVIIPYRVTEIKGYGFANCPKLKTITIPRSVTSIASTAFSYPTTMTVYGVAGTYAETWAKEKGATFVNREVKATAVALSTTEMKLARGTSETIILTVTPADFTDVVTWKSTNTDVATVASDGTVKAVGIGTATIKVFVGDVSQTCLVEVVQPVTSIGIYPSYFSMDAGEECPLNVEVYPSDAANKEVTWSSSDENVATVDQNGVVTSLSKGSAIITATALDGSGVYNTCEITVLNNLVVCNSWTALESEHNYSNSFSDAWLYTQEGATSLSVTFDDRTNIEEGFDFLYIYDGSGNQVGKYTGTELAGKTVTIQGDTIRIKLVSDEAGNAWGFKVSNVTDREYYTITLDNGGEVENTTILAANGYPMPQITPPVKLGKEFKGYFTEKDGKGDMYINADGSSARNSTFTEETTLYAYWVPAVYKVSLDANGGTCDIESIQVVYNQTYGTLPTPIWEGHAFLGWFTEKEGGMQVTDATVYTLTSNQTLYAHWETYVTVKFDANGGTVNGEAELVVTIKKGDRISEEYIAEKQNCIFTGWYNETGDLFDFSLPITSNIVLYAHWEYKYTVENPYADISTDKPVSEGTKVGLFTNTPDAQIYYTIDGSDPVANGDLYVDVITISKDTTIKMYAKKDGFNPSAVVVLNYTVEKVVETWGDIIPEDQKIWGNPANVPNKLWIAGYSDVVYSGTNVTFDLRVYDGKTLLVEKTDYTVAYKNNKLAAKATDTKAPTITVTGKGNYSGKLVQTFTIYPIDISVNTFDNKFEVDDIYVAENGKIQKPAPILYNNGKKMKVKKDYVVSYPSTGNGAYSAAGTYDVVITGSGNYCGEIIRKVVITPSILISKAKVSKIANQEYTGFAVEPVFTVSMGKETLVGVAKSQYTAGMECDYYYEYQNNVSAGKATIRITGCGKYGGEKKVTFNINGLPLKKATITGLAKSYTYTGSEIKPVITLNYIKNKGANAVALKGVAKEDYVEGVTVADYTYQFKNNVKKGTATILLTGVNNYSGTVKKTFKISACDLAKDGGQKVEVFHETVVSYEKGGSKPVVTVKFDGRTLKEGRDYTVKYSNNTVAENTKKKPAISIIGKGNFGGKLVSNFTIVKKNIDSLQLVPKDLIYKKKAGAYKVSFVITDTNGKALKAGTDYDKKNVAYTYAVDTKLEDGTLRLEGENIDKKDILPLGTVVKVTAQAKGNYVGSVYGYYRVVKNDITKAKVTVKSYSYTGNQIELTKDDLTVVVSGVTLSKTDYDIIGYTNNIKKGTATVTIRGKGEYGGTKTCKFKISSKDISK